MLVFVFKFIGFRFFGVVGVGEGFLKFEMCELKNLLIFDLIFFNVVWMFLMG